uniref:F-ATPase gamma subunit n=1 Tax=Magallana gigas TaxID=29159 RepID=K1P112_MAGGI
MATTIRTDFIDGNITQVRGMATLKEIRVRLKSVTNIQKITKSMKMVSAAKYAKAERELKPAKPYGEQATALTKNLSMKDDDETEMIIALTSDRGLCGSIHSSVVKAIKARLVEKDDAKLVLVGDKAKAMLQKIHGKKVLGHFNDIGKAPPVFQDASKIALSAIDLGLQDYTRVTMYYNSFKRSAVSVNLVGDLRRQPSAWLNKTYLNVISVV